MANFRMLFFRIFLSFFLLLNSACYLNPYFRDFVSPNEEKDSLVSLLLILIAGTRVLPVIQGETIFSLRPALLGCDVPAVKPTMLPRILVPDF